jgi:ankyrin repeat protein
MQSSARQPPRGGVANDKLCESILDAILADDADRLTELFLPEDCPDMMFMIPNYELPSLIGGPQQMLAVAAYFGALNCFRALVSLGCPAHPDSLARYATAGGNLGIVHELESLGFSFSDRQRCEALNTAVIMGHLDVVQCLWTKGVAFSSFDFVPHNPLYLASLLGYFEIVRFLVDDAAMPVAPPPIAWSVPAAPSAPAGPIPSGFRAGRSVYFNAGQPGSILEGIQPGYYELTDRHQSGLDASFRKATLAVHGACRGDHAEIVAYLLSKDSSVNFADADGFTPFDVAVAHGSARSLRLLMVCDGADPAAKQLAAVEAAARDQIECLAVFADFGLDFNLSDLGGVAPIAAAIANSNFRAVRFLFEHGVRLVPGDGQLLAQALDSGDVGIFRLVSEQSGADLARFGKALIQRAVDLGHREIIDFLLEQGVRLEGVCLSVVVEQNWFELLDHLMDCGGDPNVEMEGHPPPIICSLCRHDLSVVHHLMERGARLSPNIIESNIECVKYAISKKDQARLDLVLSYEPNLRPFRGLVRHALRSWSDSNLLFSDTAAAVAVVRSLVQRGARGFHDPAPTPRPGLVSYAGQRTALLTPVDFAILTQCMDLLRLFDEAGFDWETVTSAWPPITPVESEIHAFLTERGAMMSQKLIATAPQRGGAADPWR